MIAYNGLLVLGWLIGGMTFRVLFVGSSLHTSEFIARVGLFNEFFGLKDQPSRILQSPFSFFDG